MFIKMARIFELLCGAVVLCFSAIFIYVGIYTQKLSGLLSGLVGVCYVLCLLGKQKTGRMAAFKMAITPTVLVLSGALSLLMFISWCFSAASAEALQIGGFALVVCILSALSAIRTEKGNREVIEGILKKINQHEKLNPDIKNALLTMNGGLAFDTSNRKFVHFDASGDYVIRDFSEILSWQITFRQSDSIQDTGIGNFEHRQKKTDYVLKISISDPQRPIIPIPALNERQADSWSAYIDAVLNGQGKEVVPAQVKNING
ncbi:MAG: hypothetical protein LBJ76_06695 [Candidatus Accumulibacter sp.]|jgi:uncharacterized membrane protein YiaA|nr:hypothetical protein [Accumulibacter sp.]